jgi:hypothetical protein
MLSHFNTLQLSRLENTDEVRAKHDLNFAPAKHHTLFFSKQKNKKY